MLDCKSCHHPQDHHGDGSCDGSWGKLSETCACAQFVWPDEDLAPLCLTCRHPQSWHTIDECIGGCPCDIHHYTEPKEEDLMIDDKTRDLIQQMAQELDDLTARLDDLSETIHPPPRYRANVVRTAKGEIRWSEYTIDAVGLTQDEYVAEMDSLEALLDARMGVGEAN